jgi:hypothetical protein
LAQAYKLLPNALVAHIASFVAVRERTSIRGSCRALREAANASVQHAKVTTVQASLPRVCSVDRV